MYKNGNIAINLWFRVEHEQNQSVIKKENRKDVHDNLKKEKWIQLIVKATQKVFCQLNSNDTFYLFDQGDQDQGFPNCVNLLERVIIKLLAPSPLATTLCLTITAK